MPLTTPPLWYKKCLNPTTKIYPIRFKELLPLKLKNEVSFKGSRGENPETCVQPMTEMFECFKKNDFSQTMCAKEILAFKTCSDQSRQQQKDIKIARQLGTLRPGSEVLTTRQANVLLKRYPQHNPDIPDRWPR